MNLQIKNGKVSVKALSQFIGLKGYQSLQRKADKAGLLFKGDYIKAEDIHKALSLYRDFIVNKYGEGKWDAVSLTVQDLTTKNVETKQPKEVVKEETKNKDHFAILDNAFAILTIATLAMIIQAIQIKQFLFNLHKDANYVANLPEYMYFVTAICFQLLVLFLARRGGVWSKIWVILFACTDWAINGYLVGLFETFSIDRLIATSILPAIIGGLLTLLTDKIK